jgi:hypothetical protein
MSRFEVLRAALDPDWMADFEQLCCYSTWTVLTELT